MSRTYTSSHASVTQTPSSASQHASGGYPPLTAIRHPIPTSGAPPAPPPLPSPPAAQSHAELGSQIQRVATPPARMSSPRPTKITKSKKASVVDRPTLPPGTLSGSVPPINVLLVEDNPITLKLLEAFMKRLKVRWQAAVDGREAVNKWRTGGFHLVLMDIQLPIMSGLEATKEIRRLERLNSIGVFSSSASSTAPSLEEEMGEGSAFAKEGEGEAGGEGGGKEKRKGLGDEDRLPSTLLFKSPVIIVALTASSLQSDRHEALAAGCNDFLTKPVNFVWLERKVMEWGCMQALIDFDGWRKWKDFSSSNAGGGANGSAVTAGAGSTGTAAAASTGTGAGGGAGGAGGGGEGEKKGATHKKKKGNRASIGGGAGGAGGGGGGGGGAEGSLGVGVADGVTA